MHGLTEAQLAQHRVALAHELKKARANGDEAHEAAILEQIRLYTPEAKAPAERASKRQAPKPRRRKRVG